MKQFTINVATTAANMLDGLRISGDGERWKIAQPSWEGQGYGFLEFTQWLAEMAYYSEEQLDRRDPQDFSGVYDYEVSFEFGQWVYEEIYSKGFPSDDAARAKIDELTAAFFNKA